MNGTATELSISVVDSGEVSAMLRRPDDAFALLLFAHGAGAGMKHPFMQGMAVRLAARGVATLRYHFPYLEAGKGRPDRAPVLVSTVRAAVRRARQVAEGLPLFAGGKSLGGRMSSLAAAEGGWRGEPGGAHSEEEAERTVMGIVFFGFPLHRPGEPSAERAEHLLEVKTPMLFLQGERDSLADLELLRPVLTSMGPRATLYVVEGADHGFHVPKSSGRNDDLVMDELADQTAAWIRRILGT